MPPDRPFRPAPLSRRALLRRGSLLLAGSAGSAPFFAAASDPQPTLRFGAVTDIHYADKEARINRHYRESLDKLSKAVALFNDASPEFVVELGDFIDKTEQVEEEIDYLRTIDARFAELDCERHYVFGNHCIDTLTKEEFLEHSGAKAPHYSFEAGGFHFVVLDSCYRSDGIPYGRNNAEWTDANLPDEQLRWLEEDLRAAAKPTVVFAHQRLDGEGNHHVRNAAAARAVMERSGTVLAVLQGHSHRNDYAQVGGIHYVTLVAMVEGSGLESSGASLVSLYDDRSLRIEGFLQQSDHELASA
jgi:3',5'-cyclic AMP phosphodiesterase CpdA